MSNMQRLMDGWNETINDEWAIDIAPERLVFLRNKIMYSMLLSASRSYLYYIEAPLHREGALNCALAYREAANFYADDNTDFEKMAVAISNKVLGSDDKTSMPERPEWISEEEWVTARHEATHDADNVLFKPRIEGFVTGAYYDTPCVFPSEFDVDNARKVTRLAMQAVLWKAEEDSKFCTRKLTKCSTTRAKIYWQQESFSAKQALVSTQTFIKQHALEWDE